MSAVAPYFAVASVACSLAVGIPAGSATAQTRTLRIETEEVTRADVAVAPDGEWLVFAALGHLFRLPTSGGEAEQLTFGPWYDSDPAVSPDARRVVFASDRDGQSNGNLFVLDLESGDVRQLTNDWWAARPVWSPDGSSVGYISYEARGFWAEYEFVAPDGVLTNVRRISASGGASETLTAAPGLIRSVFYMDDGRLAWSVLDSRMEGEARTSLVVESPRGATELANVIGVLDRVVSDGTGTGLYVRQYGIPTPGYLVPQPEQIQHLSLNSLETSPIVSLENPQPRPTFGFANGYLYLGDRGQLVRVDTSSRDRREIEFNASITMEVFPRSEPVAYVPGSTTGERSGTILDPRVAPDARGLVFTAAGFVWHQEVGGGAARRVFDDEGFQWSAAISPDGRRIAYQHSEGNLQELRVADLESGTGTTLVTVDRTGRFEPAWSPDGRQLVYVGFASMVPSLYVIDVETGQRRKLVDTFPRWMPRPHFSRDEIGRAHV